LLQLDDKVHGLEGVSQGADAFLVCLPHCVNIYYKKDRAFSGISSLFLENMGYLNTSQISFLFHSSHYPTG
jgi:hypothetical protein